MMDASSDVALSLDELTVEFSDNDGLKEGILLEHPGDKIELHITEHDFCSQKNQVPENMDLDEEGGFITKEFVQVESHHDLPVAHTTDLKINASQQRETPVQSTDSEDDIAILSYLKHPKVNASSDSDSEFEVPDRPIATFSEKTSVQHVNHDTEIPLNKTSTTKQYVENNQFLNIHLTSVQSSPSQPAMLTSHEDFSPFHQSSNTLLISTAQNALQYSQSNDPVSKAATIIDTVTNISGECVKDKEKSSQDCSPKSDFLNDSTYIQLQPSENTFKEQTTFIVSPTTEDGSNDTEEAPKPTIVTTAEDWEEIQTVEAGFLQPRDKFSGPAPVIECKPLAPFSDTWTLFEAADYSSVKPQIKTQIERHGFSALKHMLFGPPKLHRDLLSQKELIFCIAATQLDNDNEIHIRVLQTIYRCLTGSKFDCQRFGGHWEEIGFQGRDPATDLRGTGMLALLHLLYFLQSSCTKDLAKDVYKLSLHPTQNFPFCLMSINLSRISLQVLREDVFNKECNSNRDVTSTINNVYAALFLRLYREWKKGKTIVDSGFVLQDIETYCRKHSKGVLKNLDLYEKTRKQQGLSRKDSDTEMTFYNVCKEDKSDGRSHADHL